MNAAEKAKLEELLEQAFGATWRNAAKAKPVATDPAFRKRMQMFLHEHDGRRY